MAPKSSRANAMILSVLVLVLAVQPVFAEEEKTLVELATGTVDKDLIEYDRKFSVIFPQQAIIDRLNIRPDMTIVDIGAGAGRFTFHLADALKGTGKVYATEINPQLVEYLKKKSEEEGYKNITIVTVSSAGVDQFYRGRTFDIIFLGGMLLFLRSPDDYLRDLRPSLALNGGRLCIVEPASLLRFNRFNLSDVTDVVSMLAKKGDDFPVLKLLSE